MDIECTTNPGSPFYWSVLTNVALTNIADVAATNPAVNPDALDLAFNNAKLDAERLAKAGGMRLAGIQTLNVGGGYDAMNRIGVPQDASDC